MGMLAATKPVRRLGGWAVRRAADTLTAHPPNRLTVWLFRGCIMDGLFSHVHDATIRTLEVNGYAVREAPGQVCCGALHAHAGLPHEARTLARQNLAAFGQGGADRSEEHTSELQSLAYLVCRLLLEKNKRQ